MGAERGAVSQLLQIGKSRGDIDIDCDGIFPSFLLSGIVFECVRRVEIGWVIKTNAFTRVVQRTFFLLDALSVGFLFIP